MTVVTQPVRVALADFGGPARKGVKVTAKLLSPDVLADGTFVSATSVIGVTDDNGVAILNCFPNAVGTGLGTMGTLVQFTASYGDGAKLDVTAAIPNQPCSLADIRQNLPAATLDALATATLQMQNYVTSTGNAAAATAADRVQTGKDAAVTAADRVQTGKDAVNSGLNATTAAAALVSALNVYGSIQSLNAAQQIMLDYANAAAISASLAASSAISATSVAQQDLSGAVVPLHRSPNVIADTLLYVIGKDGDGGVWPEKCAHMSWMNEPLNGSWLPHIDASGWQSELEARMYGSITGADIIADAAMQVATGWGITSGGSQTGSFAPGLITWSSVGHQNLAFQRSDVGMLANTVYRVEIVIESLNASAGIKLNIGGSFSRILRTTGRHILYVKTGIATGIVQWVAEQTSSGSASYCSVKPVTAVTTKANDYFNLAIDGKCYTLNGGYVLGGALPGIAETFNGNTAKHPRVVAGLLEAGFVTLYSVLEPGRPMWKRFAVGGTTVANANAFGMTAGSNKSCLTAVNGRYVIGDNNAAGFGLITIDLLTEEITANRPASGSVLRYNGNIAQRQAGLGFTAIPGTLINGNLVVGVTAMVLPDAPADPATRLQVPTIGVAINGGNGGPVGSVLMHDGTVINYSQTGQSGFGVAFTERGEVMFGSSSGGGGNAINVMPLATSNVASVQTSTATNRVYGTTAGSLPTFLGVGTRKIPLSAGKVIAAINPATGGNKLNYLRENPNAPTLGMSAEITPAYSTGWVRGDIRRAMFIDTITGSFAPSTLAFADDFTAGIANWTDISSAPATFTWDSVNKNAVLTRSTAASAGMMKAFTTIPGRTYQVGWSASGISNLLRVGTAAQGQDLINLSIAAAAGLRSSFVATTATTYVSIFTNAVGVMVVDDFSFTEVLADRSYKGKHASIVGTLTAAPAATGAQQQFWYGFSSTNYAQEAYSSDLDPATGSLYVSIWGNIPANVAAAGTAVDRSGATGPYYRFGHDATGKLVGELFDGTTTQTVTSPAAYAGAQNLTASLEYAPNGANSTLAIRVNGVIVVSLTIAALNTLTNVAAPITYGLRRDLTAPWAGGFALVKVGMSAPIALQERWAFETEREMFRDGAQVTLSDAGALLDWTYDSLEESLTVTTSGSKSKFTGYLVRTHSETPTVGAFTKVSHNAGYKLLVRNGSLPGADITIPAQNLQVALMRRSEDAARLSRLTRRMNFDVVANQQDIPAPYGWEWQGVTLEGLEKREGTNKAWVRKFDGFVETASFVTPPTTTGTAWVQGELRRTP